MQKNHNKLFILFIFTCLLNFQLFSQLTGHVIDIETGKPLIGANVWIDQSTYGTITDSDGKYLIQHSFKDVQNIVISYIGYTPQYNLIDLSTIESFDFALKEKLVSINEVKIVAQNPKTRKKYFSQFQKNFFGFTKNSKKCSILNPEVLSFNKVNEVLHVSADHPLQIRNESTGYELLFLLEKAEIEEENIQYFGKVLFTPITDPKKNTKWQKNRLQTWHGSAPHFFQSLLSNRLQDEAYELWHALPLNQGMQRIGKAQSSKILSVHPENPDVYNIEFDGYLEVVYLKEKMQQTSGRILGSNTKELGRPAEKEVIKKGVDDSVITTITQTSWIKLNKNSVSIKADGQILDPNPFEEKGYWFNERVADLLPSNFGSQFKMAKKDFELLGFKLSNLIIPFEEIKKGGPPKDGIPSIDDPKFVPPDQATFLSEDSQVIGLSIGGEARAYPTQILDYHEIVNDQIQDIPMSITYCPLCNSGFAFFSTLGGVPHSFGVSGLLYNSDVLLYDRETESLWSQIMGESISGELSGTKLEGFPIEMTTWKDWLQKHPNTNVLKPPSNHSKYVQHAYATYRNSDKLMFDVAVTSSKFKNKDLVMGIEVDGKTKAYPFKILAQKKGTVQETFNGLKFSIEYDHEANSARATDQNGQLLNTMTVYWFAWFAFHPDTEIYKVK